MDIYSDSSVDSAKPEKGRAKFIPFLLILCGAVALGFGLRYYNEKPQEATGASWEVYFSEVYAGRLAEDNPYSLERQLVTKLTTATAQIDAALYQLNSAPITDAFIEAHRRGVRVRLVTETDYIDESQIKRLQAAGIPVADDAGHDGLMHHKFIVIDERYVWTGSYNITYNGAYKNNNNVIWIDSVSLAYNFTQEFREMFLAKQFGKSSDPFVQYPHVTLSDGTQISTYFAPENATIRPLLKEIASAKRSIHFMAFSFTHDALGQAMRDSFKSGVAVQGVFEERQVNAYSEYESMKGAGIPVIQDRNTGSMHHKVIIIDEETVITGSYNFSKNAETRNSENLLIIRENHDIARAYLAEFDRIFPTKN